MASATTGSAPRSASIGALAALEVMATTSWPRSISSRTAGVPMAPLAPAKKVLVVHHVVDETAPRPVTASGVTVQTAASSQMAMTETDLHPELRPLLFSIAYRMIGSVSEAEDIVQEAFLRYHRATAGAEVENPKAYLSAVTTRLAIDHLRSARARREEYVGPWLPEPLVADEASPTRARTPSWPTRSRSPSSSCSSG